MTNALVVLTLRCMFNLGPMELVLIGAAALLVFGPRRLPELAKGLGKGIRDFKKALEGNDEDKTSNAPPASSPAEPLPPAGTVAKQPDAPARTPDGNDDSSKS